MAISPIATTPADIVSQVMQASQGQNLADLIAFAKVIEDKLKASSTWLDADNDIFEPKTGADLTPEQKLSDFQRFWSLVVNQLASTGQDPQVLLKTDGPLFTRLNQDLESLFQKTIGAVPAGQKINASDMKHLALLSVFSERLDSPILVTYQDRLFANQAKRDAAQEELKGLSNELKIYGTIQSKLHAALANGSEYKPTDALTYSDFGFDNDADYKASDVYEKLKSITKNTSGSISSKDFLTAIGITAKDKYSGDDLKEQLPNLGTSISDKSKLINDDVSLKTTELNQISSTYNSTVEAINRFVQKYHSVMQDILRQI
ncbi:V antigen (LcrV) protein [Shewanella psychrophila]|uniref:V antigen (LcrV) protein n=1 Tax=Shewanella psychrophila TaxID=225848 RepID=A0A1S6HYK3_9GAMM|nr:virulence-associated V antigen [Shewanella psychrophila]AQS40625.1 V antigen (LcrV) protein [Shewanella psychrophila]